MESGIIGAITYTHTVAANFAPTDHANLCLGLYTGFPLSLEFDKTSETTVIKRKL